MALTLVAVRNDRVMVLLLSGSFFCLALEQIGCQREEQDPAAQEAVEFSRGCVPARGVKTSPTPPPFIADCDAPAAQ
jgi:hypothetical protein